MVVSTVITNVKTSTSHDSDDQVSTAQFLAWIQIEQDRIRARLAAAIRSLYTTTASFTLTGTVLGTGDTIAKPATMLSLVRLESLVGSDYFAVPVGDELTTNGLGAGGLTFREEATNLVLTPIEYAAGTYRLTYVTKGATLTTPSPDSTIEIPPELEDVLLERVAARVRERCNEDPAAHLARADATWKEMFPVVKKRYGRHPAGGLRRVRGDV